MPTAIIQTFIFVILNYSGSQMDPPISNFSHSCFILLSKLYSEIVGIIKSHFLTGFQHPTFACRIKSKCGFFFSCLFFVFSLKKKKVFHSLTQYNCPPLCTTLFPQFMLQTLLLPGHTLPFHTFMSFPIFSIPSRISSLSISILNILLIFQEQVLTTSWSLRWLLPLTSHFHLHSELFFHQRSHSMYVQFKQW